MLDDEHSSFVAALGAAVFQFLVQLGVRYRSSRAVQGAIPDDQCPKRF